MQLRNENEEFLAYPNRQKADLSQQPQFSLIALDEMEHCDDAADETTQTLYSQPLSLPMRGEYNLPQVSDDLFVEEADDEVFWPKNTNKFIPNGEDGGRKRKMRHVSRIGDNQKKKMKDFCRDLFNVKSSSPQHLG